MLERLLESRAHRSRSLRGAAASVTAHVAVVVIAIHATAQSKPRPATPTRLVLLPYVSASPKMDPVVQGGRRHSGNAPMPRLPGPISFNPKIPPIDFSPSAVNPTDFLGGGIRASSVSGTAAESSDVSGTFRADQVEHQVSILPGAPLPTYPEALRNAGIEGRVVAQFVVGAQGTVQADSVRFIQSDNVLFEQSVLSVLKRMRFAPAEIGGRKVRQLVQMPFVFTIGAR